MTDELIKRRDEVMDVAWKALDAAWPERKGEEFVRTMRWAVKEIEAIAAEMGRKKIDPVEQGRTYRHLGSLYSDLQPAAGDQVLLDAKKSYEYTERLLEGQNDELETAKLRFNLANTLRLIDPNNVGYLEGARQRLLAARAYFAGHAPQYLPQVDQALQSVESLLRIAPLASAVRRSTGGMAALRDRLAAGAEAAAIRSQLEELTRREGGPAGMAARLQALIDGLPAELKQNARFPEVQRQMHEVTARILEGSPASEDRRLLSLLKERLTSEASRTVSTGRAKRLEGVLEDFGRILSGDDQQLETMLSNAQKMRDFIASQFEMAHYLSHGIARPEAGSRASEMVEQSWQLRRYLLEEMNRPDKGEQESKECLDLNVRASKVDRRIYEAGGDDAAALIVKQEELHPLAVQVRNFSARMQTMPAWPIWGSTRIPIDTNAALYSAPKQAETWIDSACRRCGVAIMAPPRAEGYAGARWRQLQKAMTAIFDLRAEPGPALASVAYELGIALTLGRPAVVLVSKDRRAPFDVEIEPVVCEGGRADEAALASAVDRSIVWTFPRPDVNASARTLEHVLSSRPAKTNLYVDQTLKVLERLRQAPDAVAVSRTLAKLFEYLDGGKTMLVQPRWVPVYPEGKAPRLFHVMPFRPEEWARRVSAVARSASENAGAAYVRGDEVADPDVIRSIWDEIARATHVLVDLSRFNANVALELGIAHTLGKKVLAVGQDDTVDDLFPSIRKLRIHRYESKQLEKTLGEAVASFVGA